MTKNKKRIGFLSYWGFGRGMSYVTLGFVKMLQDEYDTFILKQGGNQISSEFKGHGIVDETPGYMVPKDTFRNWIKNHKLDAVLFNEYNQWKESPVDLINIAREEGCKIYGYLVMEKFKPEQTEFYDRILVPTVSFERFMRRHKCRNFTYVPYSIDLNEFTPQTRDKNKKFTFFHPGGWGGVFERKNTDAVIEAFRQLKDRDDIKLIITSQKKLDYLEDIPDNVEIIDKELSRQEMINMYYNCDATILPSKWETIGIPILESLAAGKPVITSNVPPMNEFIINCMNGYTCTPLMQNYPDISVIGAEITPIEIKKKIELMTNEMTYDIIKRNSRKIVEQIYDLEKNKHYFLDFLEKDLK